jgi:hypothetical protein
VTYLRVSHDKRLNWRNGLGVVAVLCLLGGVATLPLPYLTVLYWTEPYTVSPLVLPIQPLRFVHAVFGGANSQTFFFNVSVVLSLPNGGSYIVANPIFMNVTLYLPVDVYPMFNVGAVDVIADGALAFGEQIPPYLTAEFPSASNITTIFLANTTNVFSPNYARFYISDTSKLITIPSSGPPTSGVYEIWQGVNTIEYSTAGQFGLTISFYNQKFIHSGILFTGVTMHTFPFITIISPDTLEIQRNNAVTISLTLFILMFAAIDVRADTNPDKSKP